MTVVERMQRLWRVLTKGNPDAMAAIAEAHVQADAKQAAADLLISDNLQRGSDVQRNIKRFLEARRA